MVKLVVDNSLRDKLGELHSPAELCDQSGHTLGLFVPLENSRQALLAAYRCPYTDEQLEQMRKEPGGRTLSEIWRSLGRKS